MPSFEAGGELPELVVTPDRYLTYRYAGASGDFNPIHIDEEFARSVGLPGRILHGLWTMAQVARAVTGAAGDPAALRSLDVRFRGPALPGQEITVTASVTEVLDDSTAVVTAHAEQGGKRIIRGAQAELRLDPPILAAPRHPASASGLVTASLGASPERIGREPGGHHIDARPIHSDSLHGAEASTMIGGSRRGAAYHSGSC